jgi:transposase
MGDESQEDSMGKTQPTYTKAFKQQAVSLFETSGKSKTQIARDFGISDSAATVNGAKNLELWEKKQILWKGHQTSLEDENRKLRRENEILRQKREILKKADLASTLCPICEIWVYP